MAGAVAAAYFGVPREIREQILPLIDGDVRNVYDSFIQQY